MDGYLEILVCLRTLRNIDLFQKGMYRVRVSLNARPTPLGSSYDPLASSVDDVVVKLGSTLNCAPRSSVDGSVISDSKALSVPAQIDELHRHGTVSRVLSSRAVHVRYRNEAFEIDDAVRFRIPVALARADRAAPIALDFDLLYASVDFDVRRASRASSAGPAAMQNASSSSLGGGGENENFAFEVVATRTLQIPADFACEGVHEFHPIVWDRAHFGGLDATLHTVLRRKSRPVQKSTESSVGRKDRRRLRGGAARGAEEVGGSESGSKSESEGVDTDGETRRERIDRLLHSSRAALLEMLDEEEGVSLSTSRHSSGEVIPLSAATTTLWRRLAAALPSLEAMVRLQTQWREHMGARWFEHTFQERSAVALDRGASFSSSSSSSSSSHHRLWIPQDRMLARTHARVARAMRKSVRDRFVRALPPVMDMGLPWAAKAVPILFEQRYVARGEEEEEPPALEEERGGGPLRVVAAPTPTPSARRSSASGDGGLDVNPNVNPNVNLDVNLDDVADGDDDGESLPPIDVVVLVHGFRGSSMDLRLFRNCLVSAYPSLGPNTLLSAANEHSTEGDLASMGLRLAHEVSSFVRRKQISARVHRLSFVGHSIGGVIIRAALAHPLLAPFIPKLHAFVTFSAPHLGLVYGSPYAAVATHFVQRIHRAIVLEQLALTDEVETTRCYMARLAESTAGDGVRSGAVAARGISRREQRQRGGRATASSMTDGKRSNDVSVLAHFRHVVLVSAHQDAFVPYHSSRIEFCDESRAEVERAAAADARVAAAAGASSGSERAGHRRRLRGNRLQRSREESSISLDGVVGDDDEENEEDDWGGGRASNDEDGSFSSSSYAATTATATTTALQPTPPRSSLGEFASAHHGMIEALLRGVEPSRVVRVDCDFVFAQRNLKTLIGRTAHVHILDNEAFAMQWVALYGGAFTEDEL